MKKIFNSFKKNILIYDLIYVSINIIINFILYLFNIRFRLWVIILILLISICGFIIGLLQQVHKTTNNIKKNIIIAIISFIPILILIAIFMPILLFIAAFSYKPEHTTTLDNKKYVAVVTSFLHVDVDYYDYYGPLLMGTKVKIHGYFGKGGYDPFKNTSLYENVEYTYYDKFGKVKKQKNIIPIRDKNGNIIDNYIYDTESNNNTSDINENYILPEDEEVLYEKKFKNIILRFTRVDYVLGQNMLVHVLRSKDKGKNYYVISDETIQVSNEAKFIFLNEFQGFAISTGKIYLDNDKTSLYVTNDSGKTFTKSNFNYENELVDFISVEKGPYYENNKLKIKCSAYQPKSNGSGYEDKELYFESNDNGLNWSLI